MFVHIPLYHGTNSVSQTMTPKERQETTRLCVSIADLAYQFLTKKYIVSKGVTEEINAKLDWYLENEEERQVEITGYFRTLFASSEDGRDLAHVAAAYRMYSYKKKGSGYFQYGNFYLTPDRRMAEKYAERGKCFGEIALIAEVMDSEAERYEDYLKSLSDDERALRKQFKHLLDSPGKPIVITYQHVPEQCLLSENGEEISDDDWDMMYINGFKCFRVCPGADIEKYRQ